MNLTAEGYNNGKSMRIIYYWKEECLSFIQKQSYANYMQIMFTNINEIDGKH